jgi:predicted metal-dependent peptidase
VKEYPMSFHNIARMFYQDEHLWMYPSETDNHDTSDDSVAHDGSNSTNPSSSGKAQQNDTEEDWKEIARKVSVDMESFHQGSGTQNLTEEINYLTRDKVDYTDFLKSFATMEEIMKLNMDEFDLSYYIHGLNMNGKMLLIEPLEYKDDYRIKEFVIAIDTSGSCSGEVIQAFIRKTYNILKTTESFSQRVNIHIIQCDDTIKQDVKITSSEELEAYISSMKLIGFGGTDFRPVFHYVDELENKNEFANLSGLIYFTDGMGTYPVNPTHYKTAFVFLENFQYADKEVPPWVLKAYWKEGGSTET